MAKNLRDRVGKLFKKNMSDEQTKDTVNEVENTEETAAFENAEATENTEQQTIPGVGEKLNESDKFQNEALEWRDKYMRLYAEFDNYRKRTIKEKSDILASASAGIIKDLLPILDDFERATKANENAEDIEAVKEGFVLIYNKLSGLLQSKGLKAIMAHGQEFDTDFHEAVTQIPAPSDDLKGKVADELEKGYLLNDKVIRYSKVVIGQ